MDIYYQKMSFEVIHAVDRFRTIRTPHPDFNRNRCSCIQSSETSIVGDWVIFRHPLHAAAFTRLVDKSSALPSAKLKKAMNNLLPKTMLFLQICSNTRI